MVGRRQPEGAGSLMSARPVLYDRRFVTLLAIMFLGFASFAIVGPVLPLMILELGGDAALVGLIVAVFSVPSVVVRPFIGRLVDDWSQRGVFLLGTAGLALSSFAYLVPGLVVVTAVRLLHGTSWAAFNTGGNTTLANLAPPERRGEAAGIFSLMPSLAHTIMPGVGLLLVAVAGTASAFLLAGFLASLALLVLVAGPFPAGPLSTKPRDGGPFWSTLIERRALLPMWLEFLWMSVNTLFLVFPPVFVAAKGLPVSDLVVYYPIVGAVQIAARLVVGRLLDRVSRGVPLLAGATCGAVALALAATADTVAVLTVAGSIYALGSAAMSPIATALAIDRADPDRRGAAMATYSLGYQLGAGLGAAIWGAIIARWGFPAPFLAALGAMLAIAVIVVLARRDLLRSPLPAPAP